MKRTMKMVGWGLVAGASLWSQAMAQQLDPRFPVVGKSVLGVTGLYAPDAVLPNPEGLNPATQNELLDYQYPPSVEVDYGQLRFRGGFHVNMAIGNYYQRLSKKTTLRVSLYDTQTNRSTVPIVAPLLVEHGGQAVEVVYAYRINKNLDAGVAIVPVDWMDTKLSFGNQTVASGEAHSTAQGRFGVEWRQHLLSKHDQLHLGAVYGIESIRSRSHMSNMQVDQAFHQDVWALGAAYDARPGSTIFWNKQRVTLRGEGLNEGRPISYWGVQQFLSKNWMLRLAKAGPGNSVNFGYLGKKWEGYVSITDRAFSSTETIYGKGTLVFFSVVRKL